MNVGLSHQIEDTSVWYFLGLQHYCMQNRTRNETIDDIPTHSPFLNPQSCFCVLQQFFCSLHQLVSGRGFGLAGCWCALVGFQWVTITSTPHILTPFLICKLIWMHSFFLLSLQSRFFIALRRLLSPDGILYSEDLTRHQMGKLKAV